MDVRDFQKNLVSDGRNVLRDLDRELKKSRTARRTTVKSRSEWRKKNAPSSDGMGISGVAFENMLMGLLCQSLFGLPMMAGLGLTDDTVQALGFLGTALHHDATEKKENSSADVVEMVSTALLASEGAAFDAAETAQARQEAELAQLRKMVMLLMAAMVAQQRRAPREDVAADVLREPNIARFKQNRQKIACIQTLFARQADMVMPKLRMA